MGDLAGGQVYKFCMGNLLCLLAYRILGEDTLKLWMVGPTPARHKLATQFAVAAGHDPSAG